VCPFGVVVSLIAQESQKSNTWLPILTLVMLPSTIIFTDTFFIALISCGELS